MEASWIESANEPNTDYPLLNLPYCVFRNQRDQSRIGTRIGDRIIDLGTLAESIALPCREALQQDHLNQLMACGREKNRILRGELIRLLEDRPSRLRDDSNLVEQVVLDQNNCQLLMPVVVGDYTDFFSSIYHATNVGAMFRPEQPLLPNYRYVPVGYHGRASSIVVSGTSIRRPNGQRSPAPPDEFPTVGPSQRLDYELELGAFIGTGNDQGTSIPIEQAAESLFGVCLVNDWSARDIQKWEYQPLGPFLSKSLGTSISPFIVTMDALEPFRCPALKREPDDPAPLPYLLNEDDQQNGGIDITLEVFMTSSQMREKELEPHKISQGNFSDMYWTLAQLVAHQTSNGCNLRPGDLLASGTISGPTRTSRGCLLERNWDGEYGDPVSGSQRSPMELPTGEKRDFLEDGDEVTLSAFCEKEGIGRIGLGTCVGRIQAAV